MTAVAPTPAKRSIWTRLYHGETTIDFVGRAKLWFAISGVVLLIGIVALFTRGLNLGIDFTGGNVWQFPAGEADVAGVQQSLESLGITDNKVQTVGDDLRVQTAPFAGTEAEQRARSAEVVAVLADESGTSATEIAQNQSTVGPSWGDEISSKAQRALVVFLILISLYITLRFELRMAVATLAALFHDILFVVGAYAVFQFPVTPATVIAILTILGFSIYDGIVVFDKVDENTRLLTTVGRMTYSDMTNLSLNQVLMRSLNTQITAVLPILSVLVVGSMVLGATTLEDFGIALLLGQISGAYSSIFIAAPVLAILKEREPRYKALRARLQERGERMARKGAAAADLQPGEAVAPAPEVPTHRLASPGTYSANHPPRPRKKGKRR